MHAHFKGESGFSFEQLKDALQNAGSGEIPVFIYTLSRSSTSIRVAWWPHFTIFSLLRVLAKLWRILWHLNPSVPWNMPEFRDELCKEIINWKELAKGRRGLSRCRKDMASCKPNKDFSSIQPGQPLNVLLYIGKMGFRILELTLWTCLLSECHFPSL